MGSCLDLRKLQSGNEIQDAYSMLVSGKKGYKAVIEKSKPIPRCSQCSTVLEGNEKFCPECGNPLKK